MNNERNGAKVKSELYSSKSAIAMSSEITKVTTKKLFKIFLQLPLPLCLPTIYNYISIQKLICE